MLLLARAESAVAYAEIYPRRASPRPHSPQAPKCEVLKVVDCGHAAGMQTGCPDSPPHANHLAHTDHVRGAAVVRAAAPLVSRSIHAEYGHL